MRVAPLESSRGQPAAAVPDSQGRLSAGARWLEPELGCLLPEGQPVSSRPRGAWRCLTFWGARRRPGGALGGGHCYRTGCRHPAQSWVLSRQPSPCGWLDGGQWVPEGREGPGAIERHPGGPVRRVGGREAAGPFVSLESTRRAARLQSRSEARPGSHAEIAPAARPLPSSPRGGRRHRVPWAAYVKGGSGTELEVAGWPAGRGCRPGSRGPGPPQGTREATLSPVNRVPLGLCLP